MTRAISYQRTTDGGATLSTPSGPVTYTRREWYMVDVGEAQKAVEANAPIPAFREMPVLWTRS